ncbi:hypothetical protein, partial [Burkholderia multivorans]|uniref:hypothetical protein n=1 Tax=Burkholderia multivorans TaxID=87883 RepID=UPI001C656059
VCNWTFVPRETEAASLHSHLSRKCGCDRHELVRGQNVRVKVLTRRRVTAAWEPQQVYRGGPENRINAREIDVGIVDDRWFLAVGYLAQCL